MCSVITLHVCCPHSWCRNACYYDLKCALLGCNSLVVQDDLVCVRKDEYERALAEKFTAEEIAVIVAMM